MLILGICGVIRSLSRVLLGFVIEVGFGMECCVGVMFLGDILFICIGFIRVWLGRVVRWE